MKRNHFLLALITTSIFAMVFTGCPGPNMDTTDGNGNSTQNEIKNFNVVSTTMYSATISWDKNNNFNKYELAIESGYTTAARITINKDDTLPVKIDGLEINTSYKATLFCYENNSYSNYYSINFKTDAIGPVENLIANTEDDSIKLSWKNLYKSNISEILIYRKTENETEFELLTAITRKSYDSNYYYIDNTVIKNKTYTYKVVTGKDSKTWESDEITITADFDNLNFTATAIGMREATFEWEADSRFDEYKLYNDSYNKNTITPSEGTTVLTATLTTLNPNKSNTVFLECYKNNSLIKTIKKNIMTKDSGPVEQLSSTIDELCIKLTWNSLYSTNVSNIIIYRKDGDDFIQIGKTTNNNKYFEDENYITGVVNKYKVTTFLADGTELGSKEISVDATGYCTVTKDWGNYGQDFYGKTKEISRYEIGSTMAKPSVSIRSSYKDELEYSYWTTDTEPFAFPTIIKKDISLKAIYKAKTITSPNIRTSNTHILLNWNNISNSKYKIELLNTTTNETTTYNDIEDCKYTFTNLEKDIEYTAFIYTISNKDDVLPSDARTVSGIKLQIPHSEWLVLLYLDGDNDLNDPIYLDLNEAEWGLSTLPSTADVKIVALWDGWDFVSNNKNEKVSMFSDTQDNPSFQMISSTRLLELGKDSRELYSSKGISTLACELSPDTLDLTNSVDWIEDNEVDMSKPSTLVNFLKWVNDNYKADKTILQFSNHGGGPRSAKLKYKNYGRRSMCWDYSNNGETDSFLKTSDVSAALSAAGYGTDKKLTMIMEDVCLGGSLEETYELKDYAEYYIGSPNNIPGMGFDYKNFISTLTKDADIKTIGSKLINSYYSDYQMPDSEWNTYFEKLNITASQVSGNQTLAQYLSFLNPSCSTLSFIDLSKISKVKDEVNKLAEIIGNDTEKDKRIKYDPVSRNYYDTKNTNVTIPETAEFISRKDAVKYHIAYNGTPIYYDGTFGTLKDLGYITFVLYNVYFDIDIENPNNSIYWSEVYNQQNEVKKALNDAIVACWRDGYKKASYYKSTSGYLSSYANSLYSYGLTINCSVWDFYTDSENNLWRYESFANWYKEELSFGRDCANWSALIEDWFGTSN